MGKLSFSDMLVRIAKIFLGYFYVCPMIFILLYGAIADSLLNILGRFDIFDISARTRFLIEMLMQFPLTFVFPILQSIRDGYRDSFYGRYSLKTFSIHWFDASWQTETERKTHRKAIKTLKKEQAKDYWIHLPNRILMKLLGYNNYQKLKQLLKKGK